MPVNVEEFSSELTYSEGELPLSEAQLDSLLERVLERIEDGNRDRLANDEATALRQRASSSFTFGRDE